MNTNTFPYYNDFIPNKKFYEILFKPGYSVQARELTQIQTMLQNQIKEFGDAIFKQGTVITGCAESHNFKTPFVKIKDIDTSVYPLSFYEGMSVSSPGGPSAIIKKTLAGSEAENPNYNTLYLHYTSNDSATGLISTFSSGDVLTIVGENTGVGTFTVGEVDPVGEGSLFSLNDGIVYVNGRFLVHTNQTIVVDRYSSNPTQKVGFQVTEEIVTNLDDPTLNDPAQGSFNFNSPGADRVKLVTVLSNYFPPEIKPDNFYLLFDIEDGVIKRRFDKTQYAELSKEFAHRTYDESGDYAVKPFPVVVSEHLLNGANHGKYTSDNGGDAGKLVVNVQPGKAYVRGYEQELLSSEFIPIDKAYTTDTLQNRNINLFYGNYIYVNGVAGPWTLNSNNTVSIRNAPQTAVSGTTYSTPAVAGVEIGTARVRNVVFESGSIGTDTAVYKLYLYDIKLDTALMSNMTSFYMSAGSGSYANIFGERKFFESKYSGLIFPLTHKNVKNLSDSSYVYKKTFNVGVSASGTFSVSLGADEEWAFDTLSDPIADDLIDENVKVIVTVPGSGAGWVAGQILDIAPSSIAPSTTQVINFDLPVTLTGSPTVEVVVSVRKNVAAQDQKTLMQHRYVRIDTTGNPNGPYFLGFHDVWYIENVWISTGNAAAGLAESSTMTADPLPGSTLWTDVTSWFNLDSGQSDTMYDHGSLIKKSTADDTTAKFLIVKLTYFEHASSGGFYSVDSYPLPAENVAATANEIEWYQIPVYTSVNQITYNLRDVLDFRSTVINTGDSTGTTIPIGTLNPAHTIAFGGNITTPVPNESFITDIKYHLSRIDRVILDSAGTFSVIAGIPSENPVQPRQPDNSMTLAFINIPAYPSLSPYNARTTERYEYASSISVVDNRRFTMRDIGAIQRRVERLEKYASLSVLEQQAASMLIPNASGNDRYKNGIIVDSFIGHNIGNVYDQDYSCSIANGEMRPAFLLDNITMEIDDISTGVVRNSNDKSVIVRQPLTSLNRYSAGELFTSKSSGVAVGSGTIRYLANVITDSNYQWLRLYLEDVVGIVAENNDILGGSSGATGKITYEPLNGVVPVDPIKASAWNDTSAALSRTLPSLVNTPAEGLLVTLPYTHVIYTESPYATKSRNCSSLILFSYEGSMDLSPRSDEWADTSSQPEILFNTDGISDNWLALTTAWGTQWENWKTLWQKFDSTKNPSRVSAVDPSVLTTSQRQLRDGISLSVEDSINVNVVPYMRSVVVTFTATRMKGQTTLYPFFDGVDVSEYCKMSSSVTYGTSLNTDASGNLVGQFRIPAETFIVGAKNFILSDISSTPFSLSATTMAYATYTASGDRSFDVNTVLSTQFPETTFDFQRTTQNSVIERQITTGDSVSQTTDPIAQTFFVSNSEGGVALTKFAIYFKTKSTTSSITLQLREVRNGYPTEVILPYSTVTLQPKDVHTSLDGTSPTEFVFSSPVYLKNDTEYAFVLLPTGNDTGYEVWVGELGQREVGTTNIIDKQPNAGTLYVSANNREWTPFINEDIKFKAFSGNFSGSGKLILHNLPIQYMTFASIVDTFYPGDIIRGQTSGAMGTIQYYNYATDEAQILVTSGSFNSTEDVVGESPATGTASGTTITKEVNAISPTLTFLDFNNTEAAWSYKMYDAAGLAFDASIDSGWTPLTINGTTELTTPMAVFSHSENFAEPAPLNNSMLLMAELSTTAANISPIVDLEKLGCVIVNNLVNTDTTNETGGGGNALSKYISRTVILEDGQDADDLMVFLSAFVPSGASIAVYAKLLNGSDVDANNPSLTFANRPWTLLTETIVPGTGTFSERKYTIPAVNLDGDVYTYINDNNVTFTTFKTFAVKIVLLSESTSLVPIIRDMRAIALQA